MEIVIGTPAMGPPGGTETYVMTVAPQFQRLGHHVTVLTDVIGDVAERLRTMGVDVTDDADRLPEQVDATYAQDAPMAYRFAARYSDARRWSVVHSAEFDLQLPPAVEGIVSTAVVMNDATARRAAAVAHPPRLLRLRQPIDFTRLAPVGTLRERNPHVLFLGNYWRGPGFEALVQACESRGSPWRHVGRHNRMVTDPGPAIADADIVVGMGRSALEGMSRGRATWVAGPTCADGWVTQTSYPAIEADGLRGRGLTHVSGLAVFNQGLAAYTPELGRVARAIVATNHSVYDHVATLADGMRAESPTGVASGPLDELALLTRACFDHQSRASLMLEEMSEAQDAWREADAARTAAEGAAQEAIQLYNELIASRRWRFACAVARPLGLARRLRQ